MRKSGLWARTVLSAAGTRNGSKVLSLNREAIFFDYRIGKHFARDALNLCLCFLAANAAVQCDLEIFALAQFVNAAIAHFLQGAVNGFALWIEHTFLERDVDVGFHTKELIIPAAKMVAMHWHFLLPAAPALLELHRTTRSWDPSLYAKAASEQQRTGLQSSQRLGKVGAR